MPPAADEEHSAADLAIKTALCLFEPLGLEVERLPRDIPTGGGGKAAAPETCEDAEDEILG